MKFPQDRVASASPVPSNGRRPLKVYKFPCPIVKCVRFWCIVNSPSFASATSTALPDSAQHPACFLDTPCAFSIPPRFVKMVVIAVAGGTGGVGKAIVEALTARGKHEIKVLARKVSEVISSVGKIVHGTTRLIYIQANPDFEAQYGVPILVVDYEDVKAVTKTLEDNNVHTIVSSIAMLTFDNSTPGEFALIEAADASKPTKRYLTSDWGTPTTPEYAKVPCPPHQDAQTDRVFCVGLPLSLAGQPPSSRPRRSSGRPGSNGPPSTRATSWITTERYPGSSRT